MREELEKLLENAYAPILTILFGIITEVKPLQLKASLLIYFTLLGMSIFLMP